MAAGFKTATVNASDVPATQTDFPVYVDLSRLGITTLAEAQSVRVYADSGKTTEWAREIVSATEMHVKVPSLTSTTAIYVDWDGTSADYAVTDTYGRNAVWTEEDAVFHLQSDETESSGTHTATDFGTPTYGTTYGKVGAGIQLTDSTGKYVSTGMSYSTGNTAKSFRFWVRFNSLADYNWVLAGGTDVNDQAYGFFNLRVADGNKFYFHGNGASADYIYTVTPAANTWYYISASYDGVNLNSLYLNGALDGTKTRALNTGSSTILLGKRQNNTFPLDGDIDEVRIRNGVTTANWITTEYNNQSDEAGFWGTWTDAGGGGGATFIPKVQWLT